MSGRTLVVDFDGTVTKTDLLDTIASRFGDPVVYREVDEGLDEGRLTLRDVITREFRPVRKPLAEVVEWELESVELRPGVHELIEPILEREGLDVDVHANRVDPRPDGWVVDWRYDESCGSCGESCKRSIARRFADGGEIVYIGDGYSDRCAAEAADGVFATRGLARYLEERGVPFEPFDDFHEVVARLRDGGFARRASG